MNASALPFTLESIVPWGRSFEEYVSMFALSAEDLNGRILGCGDGPASFNAQLTAHGGQVVSCDPLYQCDGAAIRQLEKLFPAFIRVHPCASVVQIYFSAATPSSGWDVIDNAQKKTDSAGDEHRWTAIKKDDHVLLCGDNPTLFRVNRLVCHA